MEKKTTSLVIALLIVLLLSFIAAKVRAQAVEAPTVVVPDSTTVFGKSYASGRFVNNKQDGKAWQLTAAVSPSTTLQTASKRLVLASLSNALIKGANTTTQDISITGNITGDLDFGLYDNLANSSVQLNVGSDSVSGGLWAIGSNWNTFGGNSVYLQKRLVLGTNQANSSGLLLLSSATNNNIDYISRTTHQFYTGVFGSHFLDFKICENRKSVIGENTYWTTPDSSLTVAGGLSTQGGVRVSGEVFVGDTIETGVGIKFPDGSFQSSAIVAGTGTLDTISVKDTCGVSALISNPNTKPNLRFKLGNITPTTVNAIALTGATGATINVAATSHLAMLGNNTLLMNNPSTLTMAASSTLTVNGTNTVGSSGTSLSLLPIGNATLKLPSTTDTLATYNGTEKLRNKTLGGGTKILLGSDATGDFYINGGSGTLTRLGIGSSGQVLKVSGGLPAWSTAVIDSANYLWKTLGNYQKTDSSKFFGTINNLGFDIKTNNTSRIHVNANGRVGVGGYGSKGYLDIYGYSTGIGTINMGSDLNATSRTNNTAHYGSLTFSCYSNASRSFFGVSGYGDNSNNIVAIGGGANGSSVNYSATFIGLYTGATISTSGGTLRLGVTSGGSVYVPDGGCFNIGSSAAKTYDLQYDGTSARSAGVLRNTTSNTAGAGYTFRCGGATSGSADKGGGDGNFYSGLGTGTGTAGSFNFYTYNNVAASTSDNTSILALKLNKYAATVQHLAGGTAAPTIVAGAGAGTTPTVSVGATSTDLAGYVNITTGTLPTGGAVVATITFNVPYSAAPSCIMLTPANANAALLTAATQVFVNQAGITTTTFDITEGATGLTAATAYQFYYTVIK